MNAFVHPLARWRRKRKPQVTQADIAKEIGVASLTVSRWELGINIPRPSQIVSIGDITGISPADLYFAYQALRQKPKKTQAKRRAA
jgi:transcriptional regulator with XRE-family HTH domain